MVAGSNPAGPTVSDQAFLLCLPDKPTILLAAQFSTRIPSNTDGSRLLVAPAWPQVGLSRGKYHELIETDPNRIHLATARRSNFAGDMWIASKTPPVVSSCSRRSPGTDESRRQKQAPPNTIVRALDEKGCNQFDVFHRRQQWLYSFPQLIRRRFAGIQEMCRVTRKPHLEWCYIPQKPMAFLATTVVPPLRTSQSAWGTQDPCRMRNQGLFVCGSTFRSIGRPWR